MDVQQFTKSRRLKVLLLLVTVSLIVLMFPKGESIDSEVGVNSIWIKDDLIASQTFEILKDPKVIETERANAVKSVHRIFIKKNNIPGQVVAEIKKGNKELKKQIKNIIAYPDSNFVNAQQILTPTTFNVFLDLYKGKIGNGLTLDKVYSFCLSEVKRIYRRGYINVLYPEIDNDTISVRDGKYEKSYLVRLQP